ncbi:hypothetical protein FRC01_011497, partial [Tulasnella sp. 417]
MNPLYKDVSVTDIYNPVGPWKPGKRFNLKIWVHAEFNSISTDSDDMPWKEIGDCFGQNITIAMDYTADLLIQGNYEEATIRRWLE